MEKIISEDETINDFLKRCLEFLGATVEIYKPDIPMYIAKINGLWDFPEINTLVAPTHSTNVVSKGCIFYYDVKEKFAYLYNPNATYQNVIGSNQFATDCQFYARIPFLVDNFILDEIEYPDMFPGVDSVNNYTYKIQNMPYYSSQIYNGSSGLVTTINKCMDHLKFKPKELKLIPFCIGFAMSKHLYTSINGFSLTGDIIHSDGNDFLCLDSQLFYKL